MEKSSESSDVIPTFHTNLAATRTHTRLKSQPLYWSTDQHIDLWPSDLKNNRGHLNVMTNHHSKFEDSRLNRFAVIDRKPFNQILQLKVTVTLT